MKRICVFCGSGAGTEPEFIAAARLLGEMLALRDIGIVYGGGAVGMMGALADAAMAGRGHVSGVIPQSMVDAGLAHPGVADMHVVRTMHERKALMHRMSDAFVALPGGFGTLDELFESLTWSQLGLHAKPCGLLNVNGYFDGLLGFLNRATETGFIPPEHRRLLLDDTTPENLLRRLDAFSRDDANG